jgi:hypothetical protein
VAVFVAGCSFTAHGGGNNPGDDVDAPVGGEMQVSDVCTAWTFAPADFDPCAIMLPGDVPALGPGNYILNSDSGMLEGPNVSIALPYASVNGIGVVSVHGFTVPTGVVLRVEGTKAIAISVWGTLTIAGAVDASSRANNGAVTGAGANPAACMTSIGGNGAANSSGDGGGGGGGYQAAGGKGGNGADITNSGGTAGAMRAAPTIVQGGCRGGNAPAGDGGNPGDAGPGGGGIALVARDALNLAGLVHAGGAAGTGGSTSKTGGGGGGSGGMIRLEAKTIDFATGAILAANGGQGGGGCNGGTAKNGVDGTPAATEPAQGNSESNGTDGGGGGWRDRPIGNSASQASDGGGGGGGGVGYIVYKGHTNVNGIGNVTSSPAATVF